MRSRRLLPTVQLHVNLANPDARTAYERYGFVGTGEVEPLRPGSDQRMELMVLRRDQPTRLTALITALREAVTMLASSPTPHTTSVSPPHR